MTGTTPIIKESLRLGIEAARASQKETARAYLSKVIKQEPENIPALFWLAYVSESPQESITLLERVLALDPENARAKDGIRWARKQLGTAATEVAPDDDDQSTPAQIGEAAPETPDDFIRDQLLSKEEFQERAKKGALAHKARRTIDPLLTVAIILSAAAMLTLGIWILALTPADTLAAWLPAPVENVLIGSKPVVLVPLGHAAPSKLVEEPAIQTAPSVKHFASTGDTIVIKAPLPIETDITTELDSSIPIEVLEPALEANELISLAQESSDLISTPVEEQTETVANASEAENPITTPLSNFIGPADLALTGPKLFEPVDYELLYRQPAYPDEKWIEVNVTEQRVTAWEGNVPVMSFLTSTGLPNTPTVLGEYNIYWKLASTLMTGPGYYLPEVPYTMYFYAGYALHGAYWHDNFGNPMSHGCVNLSIDNAKELFEWAGPVLPPGYTQVTSTYNNPGTLVVVHQ